MSVTRLMTLPATVTPRAVGDGDYGNDELVDGTSFDTVCFIWQDSHGRESTEDTGPENVTADVYGAAFPADVTIAAADKVTVAGLDYEVNGNPWPAVDPLQGSTSHLEVSLRKVV